MADISDIDKEELFRAHLNEHYGVNVVGFDRLDRGVLSAQLEDGRHWIARVFSPKRPFAQVEGDAKILQFLERQGFPAERCADGDPASLFYRRGILVTEYIENTATNVNEKTLKAMGEMLGRLATVPADGDDVARAADALHHYAPDGGGPEADLNAAASWLAAIEDSIPTESHALYDSLRERIAQADMCQDLPEALIHPDPVPKNLLTTQDGELVFIDWTGAGRGPRLASLALLIWSGALNNGGWSPRRVDAIVAGYGSHIRLEDEELRRLAAVMLIRPLVFACWRFRYAVNAGKAPDGDEW